MAEPQTYTSDPPGTLWLRQMIARQQAPQYRDAPGQPLPDDWTPQERYLYQHHLNNFRMGGVPHSTGEISTVYSTGQTIDGKYYVLPTVWDNSIVDEDEAVRRARQVGLDKFPSYKNETQGEARYQELHKVMERDMAEANKFR